MNHRLGCMLMLTVGLIASTGCNLIGNRCGTCHPGCRPGPIGWQRGGTDYQTHINHYAYRNQQAGSGTQAAATAYPYYTNRGPRDFLVNNPPTIGR
ncbi:MAG: hypothetical protein SGI77_07265 [Pirellulaceae bacterium]|nr:hypothetical protein [Pirellulaceae bacterium]